MRELSADEMEQVSGAIKTTASEAGSVTGNALLITMWEMVFGK
jgi:hypothetical protein